MGGVASVACDGVADVDLDMEFIWNMFLWLRIYLCSSFILNPYQEQACTGEDLHMQISTKWYQQSNTVGGWSCAESGQKTTAGEAGHRMSGGKGGSVPISKLCKDNQRILEPEWSMSEVGNPPPRNL